jgi:lipid-binding SYLF domain-containing protein
MNKLLIGLSLSFLLIGCGLQLDGSVSKQREQIDSMASGTMNNLFDQHPGLRKKVAKAAGYGVFDASGGKFLWGGLDHGNGVVVKNGNRQHTYMKMFELQPGLGFGYTNFRLVFVFDTRAAMDDFIKSGWEFGGRASAAANDEKNAVGGDRGVNVAPGITLYQMTEKGAMIGLSITGAKYWRNDDLN